MSRCEIIDQDNNNNNNSEMHQVLELALEAGEVLLMNGAEISRVEETIDHICKKFEIDNVDAFVLSNGIFMTACSEGREVFARVRAVPLAGTHLGIVTEVNSLSRDISAGKVGLAEAKERLERIKKMPPNNNLLRIIGAGIGSACFIYLLGAGFWECMMTLLSGSAVCALVIWISRMKLSKIVTNIVGGGLITLLGILYTYMMPQAQLRLSIMIIGSIFPLVPGVAFVNAIRDLADSDFIAGIVRMLDAILVFVYIAIGVGLVLSAYNSLLGGVLS